MGTSLQGSATVGPTHAWSSFTAGTGATAATEARRGVDDLGFDDLGRDGAGSSTRASAVVGRPTDVTPLPGVEARAATACEKSMPFIEGGGADGAWVRTGAAAIGCEMEDVLVVCMAVMVEQPASEMQAKATATIRDAPATIRDSVCQAAWNQQNTKKERIQDSNDLTIQSFLGTMGPSMPRRLRSTRISREDAAAMLIDRDRAALLRRTPAGIALAQGAGDLDTEDAMHACGANGDMLGVPLERAVDAFLVRYHDVIVAGPRGGLVQYRLERQDRVDQEHDILPVDAASIRAELRDVGRWDVLAWSPGMHRARFVSLDAILPASIGSCPLPFLLLRGKREGIWKYYSYNVRARCFDAAWERGTRSGWSARRDFRDLAESAILPTLSPNAAASSPTRIERRPALLRLQRRLARSFGRVLVIDGRHTQQRPKAVAGPAARALTRLARLYGEDESPYDLVLIVATDAANLPRHAMMLAERDGMLIAMREALASTHR